MKSWMLLLIAFAMVVALEAQENRRDTTQVPAEIQAVFDKPMYKGAIWGLRLVDQDSGRVLIDLESRHNFFIGSVRKIFSVGELLDQVGGGHRYNTPVFRHGELDDSGVVHGDLVLVAAGDLSMGGRTKADGNIAITNFDHNEADSLGNAQVPETNPLAGYLDLAQQVANSGVKRVTGEVIVDDRLFQAFNFRGEFDVKPIFVNDDVVDLIINPTVPGNAASVVARPVSAALAVQNTLVTSAPGSDYTLKLNPEFPQCIGKPGCSAQVTGQLPADFVPPLTRGVDNMQDALRLEKQNLTSRFHIPEHQFYFVDGSGGGETTATNIAVTKMLIAMTRTPVAGLFRDALPVLGVDGSLGFVTDFQSNPTLAGATGQVRAKTGTFVAGSESGLELKGQALGGYITSRSGRRLVFELVVNNVPITGLNQVLQVFQDQGTIAAILWRDN
jgi:D-alanyl-D-alanine carboxypeptidase